jgi:cytochrome b involved in lipid metabolism
MRYQLLALSAIAVFATITGSYFFINPLLSNPDRDDTLTYAEESPTSFAMDEVAAVQDTVSMPQGSFESIAEKPAVEEELVPQPSQQGVAQEAESRARTPELTMAAVQENNSEVSCWTVINGTVYDLTSFIERHPGGARGILRLCGKDGTESFMDQHGGQVRPEQTLERYALGPLARE